MFRFINSGIKQSITSFPNSVYHCPNLHKVGTEDDNDNKVANWKQLPINSPSKFDQTIGFYRSFSRPNNFNFDNRNLVLELSINFDLIKSIKNHKINIHLNELLQSFSPYSYTNDNLKISVKNKQVKSLFSGNNSESEKNKRLNDEENIGKFEIRKITASSEQNSIVTQTNGISCRDKIKKTAENEHCKPIRENKIENLNLLGHELNTMGCKASKSLDHETACKYWNCAASLNYPPSQFNLGVYYHSIKNFERAENFYRLAVQSGDHPVAAYNLALLLNNKRDELLKDEIKNLLTLSASQGSKEAQNCIKCINNSI